MVAARGYCRQHPLCCADYGRAFCDAGSNACPDGRNSRARGWRVAPPLEVEKQADQPKNLSLFHRCQDVQWKGKTVSLR